VTAELVVGVEVADDVVADCEEGEKGEEWRVVEGAMTPPPQTPPADAGSRRITPTEAKDGPAPMGTIGDSSASAILFVGEEGSVDVNVAVADAVGLIAREEGEVQVEEGTTARSLTLGSREREG